jgi:hypothetical protein
MHACASRHPLFYVLFAFELFLPGPNAKSGRRAPLDSRHPLFYVTICFKLFNLGPKPKVGAKTSRALVLIHV